MVRVLVRMISLLAGLSVLLTIWFVAAFAAAGGLEPLLATGWIGSLTFGGWAITLVAGPLAAVQLWRFRESGRRAGIVLFGSGFMYYTAGLLGLRSPEASVWQIVGAAATFALPLIVLLLPHTRMLFVQARPNGAGRAGYRVS